MESKQHRNERLRKMRQKYGLGEYKKEKSHAIKKTRKRVSTMAKRSKHRSSRKSGVKGLMSMKNIIGTIGGAYASRYVGVSPAIGAAAGSYLYGKQGITGAAVGYFIAPTAMNMLMPMVSKVSNQANAGIKLY